VSIDPQPDSKATCSTTDPASIAARLRLQYAREEWGADGQPDSKGGVIGGQLLMRADLMGSMEEAFSNNKACGDPRSAVLPHM